MTLANKVVLVTGAGRGMGRGIAQACAEAGAAVVVGDLDIKDVTVSASTIVENGGRALAVEMNVTDAASVAAAIAQAVQTFGRLDGLVNNAGVIKMAAAFDLTPAEWDWHFTVNATGVFLCCQLAARQFMAQAGGGAIVNIASNAGKVGYNNMAAYNASKAAVINLTRSLAAEWAAQNINVNAVCPGGVNTPMLLGVAEFYAGKAGQDPHELVKNMKPKQLDRHVEPIEVGRVVAFLLSDNARIIRGQSINVDGGDTPY